MHRSRLTLFLALTLTLSVFAVSVLSSLEDASASEHEALAGFHAVSKQYFPFVPNEAMIGETGPWHATMTVKSMQADPITIWVLPDGHFDPEAALTTFTLHSSFESRSLTVEELGIEPGAMSSLAVAAIDLDVWRDRDSTSALALRQTLGLLPQPEISASIKLSSPEPMQDMVWTNPGHKSVDGYTAIPMNDVGWGELSVDCPSGDLTSCADIRGLDNVDGMSYLPLVQTNSGWNTLLYVTNVEGATDDASTVEVELIPSSNGDEESGWTGRLSMEPGQTWAIDVLEEVGPGWTGSVRISSEAGTAAVAARHKPETDMLLMNTSAPSRADGENYALFAPLVYTDFRGWNTGISLANQSDEWNTITVSMYDDTGNLRESFSRRLPSNGQANIYLPGEVDQDATGWIASAVLESESGEPFHAAVDQVNYENGSAMSYTLGANGAVAPEVRRDNDRLGLPLLQKSRSQLFDGDTTGIQLFNPHQDENIEVEIRLMTSNGSQTMEVDIGPRASYNFHVPDMPDIDAGTVGSVVLTALRGEGEIIAVSNLTNYAVRGDGAVALVLSNGSGQIR